MSSEMKIEQQERHAILTLHVIIFPPTSRNLQSPQLRSLSKDRIVPLSGPKTVLLGGSEKSCYKTNKQQQQQQKKTKKSSHSSPLQKQRRQLCRKELVAVSRNAAGLLDPCWMGGVQKTLVKSFILKTCGWEQGESMGLLIFFPYLVLMCV